MRHDIEPGRSWWPRSYDPEYVGRHRLTTNWILRCVDQTLFKINLKGGVFHE